MEKADRKMATVLELLDMWRERQPGSPSRLEALERLGLPKEEIYKILNSEER